MLKSIIDSRRITLLVLLVCLPIGVLAQRGDDKLSQNLQTRLLTTNGQEKITLFIYFKDKGNRLEEKLLAAKNALSARSLQRRIINRGVDNVVSFADIPINPDYLNLIKTQVTKIRHPLKAINAVSVEATPAAITKILNFEFVQKIDLVKTLKRDLAPQTSASHPKPSAESLIKQSSSALALDYGSSFAQNNQIKVPAVHELGYTGSGVVIAVFDTGFNRLSHESFNQMDIANAWDFVNDDSDVADGTDMGTGNHGTSTLSTMGGYSPGNLIGPAFGATYYLAKTENIESELHIEEDNWCAAADWADVNGAQIIASSLGYRNFDVGTDYGPADMDGGTTVISVCADLAAQNGIVVINSVGNNGTTAGETTLTAPADGHFVLAVGAVSGAGNRLHFSSVGPSADGRIKPDVMAMGFNVQVASSGSDTSYRFSEGTSFSSPLAVGVAALVLEANPELSAAQVRDILRTSGNNSSTPDNFSGYGLLDTEAAIEAAIGASGSNFAPFASFAMITDGATSVNLTNTSTDSDGTIVSYLWEFGDGSNSLLENPSHTFVADGTYTIALTVTDNQGMTDKVSRVLAVTSFTAPPVSSSGGGSIGYIFVIGLLISIRTRKQR